MIPIGLFFSMKILMFASCLPQIIYDIVQKILEVPRELRYSLFICSKVRHIILISLQIFISKYLQPYFFLSERSEEKNKLTFRWKMTCVDWPLFCPSLTSSRCSSFKIKWNPRPRSLIIVPRTPEKPEQKGDPFYNYHEINTINYTHTCTHTHPNS